MRMQKKYSDLIPAYFALVLLVAGCVLVLWPFLTALIWAAILVSTSWPVFLSLNRLLGERRIFAASLMTLLVTLALLGPVTAVALALVDNVTELARVATALLKNGLPDAPVWLTSLPLAGQMASASSGACRGASDG